MRKHKYILPIFGHEYEIWIVTDKEEATKTVPQWREDCNGKMLVCNRMPILVIMENSEYRAIVHECEHLKNYILSDVGVNPDYDNDETDAYVIAHLFQRVIDFKENKKSPRN